MVVEDTATAANGSLAVARRESKTDTGAEALGGWIALEELSRNQGGIVKTLDDPQIVILLFGNGHEFVAQAQVECQGRADLVVILEVRAKGPLVQEVSGEVRSHGKQSVVTAHHTGKQSSQITEFIVAVASW